MSQPQHTGSSLGTSASLAGGPPLGVRITPSFHSLEEFTFGSRTPQGSPSHTPRRGNSRSGTLDADGSISPPSPTSPIRPLHPLHQPQPQQQHQHHAHRHHPQSHHLGTGSLPHSRSRSRNRSKQHSSSSAAAAASTSSSPHVPHASLPSISNSASASNSNSDSDSIDVDIDNHKNGEMEEEDGIELTATTPSIVVGDMDMTLDLGLALLSELRHETGRGQSVSSQVSIGPLLRDSDFDHFDDDLDDDDLVVEGEESGEIDDDDIASRSSSPPEDEDDEDDATKKAIAAGAVVPSSTSLTNYESDMSEILTPTTVQRRMSISRKQFEMMQGEEGEGQPPSPPPPPDSEATIAAATATSSSSPGTSASSLRHLALIAATLKASGPQAFRNHTRDRNGRPAEASSSAATTTGTTTTATATTTTVRRRGHRDNDRDNCKNSEINLLHQHNSRRVPLRKRKTRRRRNSIEDTASASSAAASPCEATPLSRSNSFHGHPSYVTVEFDGDLVPRRRSDEPKHRLKMKRKRRQQQRKKRNRTSERDRERHFVMRGPPSSSALANDDRCDLVVDDGGMAKRKRSRSRHARSPSPTPHQASRSRESSRRSSGMSSGRGGGGEDQSSSSKKRTRNHRGGGGHHRESPHRDRGGGSSAACGAVTAEGSQSLRQQQQRLRHSHHRRGSLTGVTVHSSSQQNRIRPDSPGYRSGNDAMMWRGATGPGGLSSTGHSLVAADYFQRIPAALSAPNPMEVIQSLRAELTTACLYGEGLRAEIEALEGSQQQKMAFELKKLAERLTAETEVERERTSGVVAHLEQECHLLRNERNSLRVDLRETRSERHRLEVHVEQLKNDIVDLNRNVIHKREQIGKQREVIAQCEETLQELQQERQLMKKRTESLDRQVVKLKASNKRQELETREMLGMKDRLNQVQPPSRPPLLRGLTASRLPFQGIMNRRVSVMTPTACSSSSSSSTAYPPNLTKDVFQKNVDLMQRLYAMEKDLADRQSKMDELELQNVKILQQKENMQKYFLAQLRKKSTDLRDMKKETERIHRQLRRKMREEKEREAARDARLQYLEDSCASFKRKNDRMKHQVTIFRDKMLAARSRLKECLEQVRYDRDNREHLQAIVKKQETELMLRQKQILHYQSELSRIEQEALRRSQEGKPGGCPVQ